MISWQSCFLSPTTTYLRPGQPWALLLLGVSSMTLYHKPASRDPTFFLSLHFSPRRKPSVALLASWKDIRSPFGPFHSIGSLGCQEGTQDFKRWNPGDLYFRVFGMDPLLFYPGNPPPFYYETPTWPLAKLQAFVRGYSLIAPSSL